MEKLLTAHEVAEVMDCHPQSVYRNKGLLHINIPGVGKRFKGSDLEKYLEQNTIKPKSLLICKNPPNSFNLTNLDEYDKLYLKQNKGGNSGSMNGKKTRWNYGFGSVYIRKTTQGKSRWYVDYLVNGKRIREVVQNAQGRAEAVLHLKEKSIEAFNQLHNSSEIKAPIYFTALTEHYMKDYAISNKKTWKNDLSCIEANLKPFFGKLKLDLISPQRIEKYKSKRLDMGVTKTTVNRDLALLRKMFNLAIDWGYVSSNPVNKVKFYSEKDGLKERILTWEEEHRLLEASPTHLKPVIVVALNTGMRRGEILNLKWDQIDFEKGLIKVENTKSGKNRYIHINSDLANLLLGLSAQNEDGEFVFTNPDTGKPYTDPKRAFKKACRIAGIEDLRFHDLRHTFASRLVENGVDLITVKDLLGHSTVKMTERYTHPNQDLKKKAVEMLVRKSRKGSKKADILAQICHMKKDSEASKDVTPSLSIN